MARKHTTRDQGGVLYRVTNLINGKRYYGITAFEPADFRWTMHVEAAKRGKQARICRAIRKYGADAFHFKALKSFETTEDLSAAERHFIAALRPEYNTVEGGLGVRSLKHSDEARAKMSVALKRVWAEEPERFANRPPHSAETRRRMSEAGKANPSRPWLGKKRSAETIAKIKATKATQTHPAPSPQSLAALRANAARQHDRLKKPIRCLWDMREFESGTQAANYYGVGRTTPNAVANGRIKQVRGLTFEWIGHADQ